MVDHDKFGRFFDTVQDLDVPVSRSAAAADESTLDQIVAAPAVPES